MNIYTFVAHALGIQCGRGTAESDLSAGACASGLFPFASFGDFPDRTGGEPIAQACRDDRATNSDMQA
jgi:hypothetical protein